MRFDLDHDWQGNMSTPRAKVGERAKTRLLIILCAIWLFIGLLGHSPWKPLESQAISTIKTLLSSGNFIAPSPVGSGQMQNPPLYYITAAFSAQLLGHFFPFHDAARIVSGLWMTITLMMIGMSGRELWGKGFGRQTTFVFIGALGLAITAHTLTPAVSALTGLSTGFYALALCRRRPYRASVLLALAFSVSFLSTGILPLSILLLSCIMLPLLFLQWRNASYLKVFSMALLFSIPFLAIWPILCLQFYPIQFNTWWETSLKQFGQTNYLFFMETLLWYAWPALPLALWGFWRFRHQLLYKPKFQLVLVFLFASWLLLGFGAERKEIFALPLLIPLTMMGGGCLETLKRGAAGALNWFGLILFGIMSGLIWLGWAAMLTGNPARIKARIMFLSGLESISFNIIYFALATAATLIWLLAIFRTRHTNRSTATNWAIGITCVWTLLMTLWLPMIDNARSYSQVFASFQNALPKHFACVTAKKMGEPQRDLLYYYTNIKAINFESAQRIDCDLYLIQDNLGNEIIVPGPDWNLIWSGKRPSDRKESFRLFQHN